MVAKVDRNCYLNLSQTRRWRNIAIALTDTDFGEQKAQSGENAWLRQSRGAVVHFVSMTMEENVEVTQKKRFRYGLVLAWVPLTFFIVPAAIGIIRALAQVSNEKATGLAAVAGGFAEVAATFGLVVIIASEVVAIAMLVRTFSRSHMARNFIAIFSVGCSGLLLLVLGLFLWFGTGHH